VQWGYSENSLTAITLNVIIEDIIKFAHPKNNNVSSCEYILGVVFKKLYFLCNIRMGTVLKSVCLCQAF
jgi:hypothetical protein